MDVIHFARTTFPAAVLRTCRIGDFVLSETRYSAAARLPTHAHEYACVVVVLQGKFGEQYGARQRTGEPGMIIIRPEGEPHSDHYAAEGGSCLNVELPPHWLGRIRPHTTAFDASAAFRGSAFFMAGQRLHRELLRADDVSPLAVESALLGLAADSERESRRPDRTPPRWLLRVREHIHANVAEHLSLSDLASTAGVHAVHLAATFRRFFGMTVAAYVRQLRIEQACRAMVHSDAALADIALAAGFADQSHFGRTFKRAMGLTPAEYRRGSRNLAREKTNAPSSGRRADTTLGRS